MVLSLRFLCTLSYEFFLCAHEALAFLSEYALWWYVHSRSLSDRVIFYVLIGIYCFTIALKLCALIYRNDLHRGRPPRAVVHRVGGGYKIQLTVQRKLKAKAGQYINLWMSSVSFGPSCRAIPSCSPRVRKAIERLWSYWSKPREDSPRSFSGMPITDAYGSSHPVWACSLVPTRPALLDRVVMVASGFDVIPTAPHSWTQQLFQPHTTHQPGLAIGGYW